METWFWILGWSLSLLTIAGNGFIVFLVCSKRQLRTKTNAFVVSLALADFCVGISVVPPMFFCEMSTGCSLQSYWISFARWSSGYASVISLCILVLDRYIAVVKPLKYLTVMTRRRVIQTVSIAWGFLVFYRTFCALKKLFFEVVVLHFVFWFDAIILEFLPCLILIFCFASMLHIVCKHHRASRTTAKQLRFNHHRALFKIRLKSAAAVKLTAVVIGVFLLCYGFYIRCSFVHILNEGKCNDEEYKIPLLVLNSAINPLVYAFLKRDIKRRLKNYLSAAAEAGQTNFC